MVETYSSETRAAEAVGLTHCSAISSACINKNITCKGFIWRFNNEPLKKSELKNIQMRSKPIKQYDENGTFIKSWSCIKEAADTLNISASSIGEICRHNKKRHLAGGFLWAYYDKLPVNNKIVPFKGKRKVCQIDPETLEIIREFDSLADAANTVSTTWQGIQRVCGGKRKRCKGFMWKFKDQCENDLKWFAKDDEEELLEEVIQRQNED